MSPGPADGDCSSVTGENVTYIFPDCKTCLTGTFTQSRMVEANVARICSIEEQEVLDCILHITETLKSSSQYQGVMNIQTEPVSHLPYSFSDSFTETDLLRRDPYEEKLVEVPRLEHPGMSVSGYLLPPEDARKSRRGQYLFLNGRPVEDQAVWRALAEAHRGMLTAGRHPVAWLWLEMDPLLVDVNVHPAKREVRFHRPAELRTLIMDAVGRRSQVTVPGQEEPVAKDAEVARLTEILREDGPVVSPAVGESADIPVGEKEELKSRVSTLPPEARTWRAEVQEEFVREESPSSPSFRVIGVLERRYLLLEAGDGLVLLEGEAARERILYEGFLRGARDGAAESQGLLVPLLLELEARDTDVALRNAENFQEAGMEVESFGGGTVQVRSMPALLEGADPRQLLLDLVDELVKSAESRSGRVLTFEKFAGELAKVGARGERCRPESAQVPLDQLFACDLPYSTPAGRPVLVQFSFSDLRRKFGK